MTRNSRIALAPKLLALLLAAALTWTAAAQQKAPPPKPIVARGPDGRLVYTADERGNRVPDFSYCGYMAGDVPIPDAPIRIVLSPVPGDNTARIQAAIDYVASLPVEEKDLAGAVLLEKGRYEIAGGLLLNASRVVLRGQGSAQGTTLIATGHDRRALIRIAGSRQRDAETSVSALAVADEYVPVNAMKLRLKGSHGLKAGDSVFIRRPSTREWIETMGMDDLGGDRHGPSWKPGSRDIVWDRTITAVDADTITIDAPLTAALDAKFGGGTVTPHTRPGRISHVGIENLSCESTFDAANPKDENHSWFGITIENAQDAWVRQVNFRHFAGSAVAVWDTARRVTVEDCKSLEPVSEIGGWRRNTFFTSGQQVLMQRLYSEDGRHDFAVGFAAAGPNAFVQCESLRSNGESGSIDSWACGTLFDLVRIDGNALTLRNRAYESQGSGWAAANSVLWNSTASVIECWTPPTAQNWALGTWGEFSGDGYFYGSNDGVSPDSLYYGQLSDRTGAKANERAQLLLITTDASSSPSPETAAELIRISQGPAPSLSEWIDRASQRQPIPTSTTLAPASPAASDATSDKPPASQKLAIENGWLLVGGRLLTGGRMEVPWWSGGMRPAEIANPRPAVTRYVPGRVGPGLTDDLNDVIATMQNTDRVALEQHYALWYDRRRDDHERIRRMDGNVVPPFYEVPFSRSGQGLAWDGLSKYDLTKFNPWYWDRLRSFAGLCEANGLVLIHQQYFQHNILEAGAHYADFPWRSANNINDTGFPEPPYYAGDKRIFMAEQFYDLSNPKRRELHRRYIRKCLDSLTGSANVIQLTSEEFTGPLHFVQFWLDTVAEWEQETGKKPIIGLSCTKDVQDAILADPTRAAVVSLIDIRYWWPQADGTFYAPPGGKNLAPRQWARVMKPKQPSFESIVKCIRDYRSRFPNKPVIYSADGQQLGWAVLFGGGSLPSLRRPLDPKLAAAIVQMKPVDLPGTPQGQWVLGVPDDQYLIHTDSGAPAGIDMSQYRQHRIDENVVWLRRK